MVLAVTAIVRATGRAEAVNRRTSLVLSIRHLLWLLMGEARGGDTLPWWGNGLRLDVYALAGVDGEV